MPSVGAGRHESLGMEPHVTPTAGKGVNGGQGQVESY